MCSGNMHMQAYFSIFTLIMPSKANHFNHYSNCCWRSARALLPLPADFFHLSHCQIQWSFYSSEHPQHRLSSSLNSGFLAVHAAKIETVMGYIGLS